MGYHFERPSLQSNVTQRLDDGDLMIGYFDLIFEISRLALFISSAGSRGLTISRWNGHSNI